MNELILFGIIVLILIRLIGIIVSIDFYYDSKSKTYIYLTIAWTLWVLSGMFPLLYQLESSQTQQQFFLFMNYLVGPLSLLFLISGLTSYYLKISPKVIVYLSIILLITPFIVYFSVGLLYLSIYNRVIIYFSFIFVFLLPCIKFKTFKKKIGKSIRWYYLTLISLFIYILINVLFLINNVYYGIYTSEDLIYIIIGYASINITTILIIAFIIHLEYNISYEQKKDLKDVYSHNLGNILQAIETAHFLTELNNQLEETKLLEAKKIIEQKFKEASETLNEIRKL